MRRKQIDGREKYTSSCIEEPPFQIKIRIEMVKKYSKLLLFYNKRYTPAI